jgi:hypothetical protein
MDDFDVAPDKIGESAQSAGRPRFDGQLIRVANAAIAAGFPIQGTPAKFPRRRSAVSWPPSRALRSRACIRGVVPALGLLKGRKIGA